MKTERRTWAEAWAGGQMARAETEFAGDTPIRLRSGASLPLQKGRERSSILVPAKDSFYFLVVF
jgi:hypothetical protein